MLETAEQGLMLVGGVEDWATSKRIARLPKTQGSGRDDLARTDTNPTIG